MKKICSFCVQKSLKQELIQILLMTRCDYDAVFYRVFCITLLAIAFTFTIVLTNVFIDIDGLLANKQGKHKAPIIPNNNDSPEELTPEPVSNDDVNYRDNYDSYRTKRSIETQNFLFHIKNPKIKNILTNRLSHLLEALDADEAHAKNAANPQKDAQKESITMLDDSKDEDEKLKKQKDEDILHLTMHNILLQGIIGHMNMNDVYKRVTTLMHNFNNGDDKSLVNKKTDILPIKSINEEQKTVKPPGENTFLTEFIKCHERRDHKPTDPKTNYQPNYNPGLRTGPDVINPDLQLSDHHDNGMNNNRVGSNVLIKAIIDIKPNIRDKNDTTPKDNVHGVIELIFNGKSMKFTRSESEINQNIVKKIPFNKVMPKHATTNNLPETTTQADMNKKNYNDLKKIPKDYLNKFVAEYFKHFPSVIQEPNTHPKELNETNKRIKRHVKVKASKKYYPPSHKKKQNPDDDDLYVEIETHINKKDMKAEKKKKLIKNLIEKIQKAIVTKDTKMIDTAIKKKRTKWRVRKRQQDPLINDTKIMINKISIPMDVLQRQLDPITIHKTIPKQESSINVHNKKGNSWTREYIGPSFLAATKAINSAEMSELDVDYKNVLSSNGVPQRLQKPLNTDMSPETMNPNYDLELGHVLAAYDQPSDPNPDENWDNDNLKIVNFNQAHDISRRSINNNHDYHSNVYKMIYDGNALPFHDYKDIFHRSQFSKSQTDPPKYKFFANNSHLTLDDIMLDKNLQPAEIFGLANMFHRKKRTLSVKRISNIKSKRKINRYLNTKAMSKRNRQFHKKRNKRQINKIRIIASDFPHKHNSEENVYVVAEDDNVFADRATVKEEKSELEHEAEESEMIPYHTDFQEDTPKYRLFDGKSRHNALMSKFPHVFMEEITRSREDLEPDTTYLLRKVPDNSKYDDAQTIEFEKIDLKSSTDQDFTVHPDLEVLHTTEHTSKEQYTHDMVNDLQDPKSKYKVTLKISPKNTTAGLHGGFKEVYTSINKRFNKNGLQYLSLVNVSEISKITKINKTKNLKDDFSKVDATYLSKSMNDQEDKMQMLLREHQKNIDEQLNRLNEEKFKIESILIDDNNTVIPRCDYLDGILQTNNKKSANPDENNENVTIPPPTADTTILIPITTTPASTILPSTTVVSTTLASTTPASTTLASTTELSTTPSTTMTAYHNAFLNDNLKKKIIHTIERNENLTNQILKKIDKNSEILLTFLKKLTEKTETKLPENKRNKEEETDTPTPNKIERSNNYSPDLRPYSPPLSFNSNYVLRRNDSHISIPFVYAYPQSLMNHKTIPAVGNIYHSHMHPNRINPRETPILKETILTLPKVIEPNNNNQTRFFLDDIENDYKVIPMNNIKLYQLHKNATVRL